MKPEALVPGETVLGGRYRLLRLLARGGVGAVYAAEDATAGRKVAIKLLGQPASRNPTAAQRLYTEANAVNAVGHPNIVRVFDIGHTGDGTPYLVMELLEGQSLDAVLHVLGTLEPPRAVDIVAQILSALAAAHDKGIVHRDLKPQNVFLCRGEGGRTLVKVLDFGISKVGAVDSKARLTMPGIVVGTPHFMSPEHAAGSRNLDGQTDIWSAGVVLYQALAGRLPYDDESVIVLMGKIIDEPVPPPRAFNPAIPEALERVVLTALAKDRSRRYQTAVQFRAELLAAAAQAPTATLTTASAVAPAPPAPRGRPAIIAVGVVLATLVLGALAGVALFLGSSGEAAPRTTPSSVARAATGAASAAVPPAAQPDGTVELAIQVAQRPAGTRVEVDGQPVPPEAEAIRVSAGAAHAVAFSAPGHHTILIRLTLVGDTAIEMHPTPIEDPLGHVQQRPAAPALRPGPRGASRPAPAPVEPPVQAPQRPAGGRPSRILEEYPE